MKRFSEQFYTKATSVKLQAAERRELRERVVSYMEYHPLPATQKRMSKVFLTDTYRTVRIPFALLLKWSAATAALVLVMVPFLAEQTVPGDNLYAVKVRFNEEVRGTLTFNPYQKVEWETERLNRRIAEARLLASEGRMTDEVEAEMAQAVREHTANVQREIEVLRQDDADEAALASIELNTTLQVQSNSLRGEVGEAVATLALAKSAAPVADSPTQMLVDVLDETLMQQEAQASSSTIPAYEKIMARVEINTTRAYELLASLNLNPEDPLQKNVNRRLEDVGRSIEQANGKRGESEEAAQALLVNALQRTQSLIVFMTEANVSDALDLNSIVPIVLTPEEEEQALTILKTDIEKKVITLETARASVTPPVVEKIDFALQVASDSQAQMASSSVFAEKEMIAKDLMALLDDSITLAESEGFDSSASPVTPPEEETATSTEAVEEPVVE